MAENEAYRKKLEPIVDAYTALTEIAAKTAELTNTQYYGSDVYFAVSTRYLADTLNAPDNKTHKKTVLLAALGIIEKVDDADLPANIQSRDYLFARDIKDTYGADRTIQ